MMREIGTKKVAIQISVSNWVINFSTYLIASISIALFRSDVLTVTKLVVAEDIMEWIHKISNGFPE